MSDAKAAAVAAIKARRPTGKPADMPKPFVRLSSASFLAQAESKARENARDNARASLAKGYNRGSISMSHDLDRMPMHDAKAIGSPAKPDADDKMFKKRRKSVSEHDIVAPLPPPQGNGGNGKVTPIKPGGIAPTPSVARKSHARFRWRTVLHIADRVGILICALFYIILAFRSSWTCMYLLRGKNNPTVEIEPDTFPLMSAWLGTSSIRQSPILMKILQDKTAPVNGTLYLETEQTASFSRCTKANISDGDMYSDEFQRVVFKAVSQGRVHMTDISSTNMELVVPVVDCTSSLIQDDDHSSARFFFLTRQRADPESTAMVVVSISNQEYYLPEQRETGPGCFATVEVIRDMSAKVSSVLSNYNKTGESDNHGRFLASLGYPYEAFRFREFAYVNTTVTGMWTMLSESMPGESIRKILQTSSKSGFYIKAETEQSNLNNRVWTFDTDPIKIVSRWRWMSTPVLKDSWGWVHGLQFFFAMSTLANLVILLVATYRNVRAGKMWIGDAFVSISSQQMIRGILVQIAWFTNEYWVLHEFCIRDGFALAGLEEILIYEAPIHADLLTMFLSFVGIVGLLMRERIDPLFATVLFEAAYSYRRKMVAGFPAALQDILTTYPKELYWRGIVPALDGQDSVSPMRYWTNHALGPRRWRFVFVSLLEIFCAIFIMIVYLVARKIFHRVYPSKQYDSALSSNITATAVSGKEVALTAKRMFTLFEIATGAELENRFGLVCDYDRNIVIKGMKYASADGIYSNGFVIANQKYLVQTGDVWTIITMKVIRKRFKNVYVYDVQGHTVQQTARLVYPDTLRFADLLSLNVNPLT